MPLQPLTTAGVSAKITELYALSASALNAQADLVEADFKDWVKDNFSLTTAQSTYLTGMDAHAATYFGSQCSIAFRFKRTITLDTGDPLQGTTKWVMSESTLVVSTNEGGTLKATGTLAFKFDYRN